MKRPTQVPLPLFDRLVDEEPGQRLELRSLRTLDREGLLESVRRELARLLNSRVSLPVDVLLERPATVLDYGMPDGASLSPQNHEDRERMGRWMQHAIEAFEPRLTEVQVDVDLHAEDPRHLAGRIRAMLIVDGVKEPVSFETVHADEVRIR